MLTSLVWLTLAGIAGGAQTDRVATLAAAKAAVEARLAVQQNNSTLRVISVTATNAPKVGGVLAVTLRPPTTEKFDFWASTTFIQIWQALAKVPNAYDHLARVQLTLTHLPNTVVIDCPSDSVEESYGFTDYARLKRLCQVR